LPSCKDGIDDFRGQNKIEEELESLVWRGVVGRN